MLFRSNFTLECRNSFETLKKAFTTAPVLTHWVLNAQIILETNASNYPLAAILSIVSPDDSEVHPIAFHSWTFTAPELNYNVHDKELLMIFEAFKIWRHYLEGPTSPIDVITDHKTNISRPPNFSPDDKSDGPNICHNSTSSSVSAPADSDPNPTL